MSRPLHVVMRFRKAEKSWYELSNGEVVQGYKQVMELLHEEAIKELKEAANKKDRWDKSSRQEQDTLSNQTGVASFIPTKTLCQ